MGWYRADTSRARHPKIRQLARSLGIHRLHAVGIHEVLCSVPTDTMQIDGYLGRLDPITFAEDCDWTGDPNVLWAALEDVGLVDVRRGGRRYVHDFQEWAGSTKEAVRKAQYRERQALKDGSFVPGQSPHTNERTDERTNERTDGRTDGRAQGASDGSPSVAPAALLPDPPVMMFPAQGRDGRWALTEGHLASLQRSYTGIRVRDFLEHMRGKAERGALRHKPKDYTRTIENWLSREANDPRSPFQVEGPPGPRPPGGGGAGLPAPELLSRRGLQNLANAQEALRILEEQDRRKGPNG